MATNAMQAKSRTVMFLLKENATFQIAMLRCSDDYVCFCPELLLLLEKC